MTKRALNLLLAMSLAVGCSQPPTQAPDDEAPTPIPSPPPAVVAPVDRSADPLLVELDPIETGTEVTFEIPRDALGFNIVVEDVGGAEWELYDIGIDRIVAPDGTIVHDRYMPAGGSHVTSISRLGRIVTASVPMGDEVPTAMGGTWKMLVAVPTAPSKKVSLRASIRIQTAPEVFRGGALDVHVHLPLPSERGVVATRAGVESRLDEFFSLWSELFGIGRGEVTYFDEAPSLASIDVLEKGTALRTANIVDGTKALQVLFTRRIVRGTDEGVTGYSPAIPGAATRFGTNLSGIVVVATTNPLVDATTLVHEAGHFFGLNHTTEFDGTELTDPLSDTPSCALEPLAQANPSRCPDKSNLMFGAGVIVPPIGATDMQRRVVRGSPIYRAF